MYFSYTLNMAHAICTTLWMLKVNDKPISIDIFIDTAGYCCGGSCWGVGLSEAQAEN